MMIRSYTNPFPGELAHEWKNTYRWTWKEFFVRWVFQTVYGSPNDSTSASSTVRSTSLLTMMILFLQWFVSFPYELQRMMVRFAMPFVLSALIIAWQMMNNEIIKYTVLAVIVMIMMGLLYYFRARNTTLKTAEESKIVVKESQVQPAEEEDVLFPHNRNVLGTVLEEDKVTEEKDDKESTDSHDHYNENKLETTNTINHEVKQDDDIIGDIYGDIYGDIDTETESQEAEIHLLVSLPSSSSLYTLSTTSSDMRQRLSYTAAEHGPCSSSDSESDNNTVSDISFHDIL